MIQSLIHTSENNNLYIYDHLFRLSMLIHPELKRVYEKSTDTNLYYLKKFEYLKKFGLFSKPALANFGTLDESMIKENIINTKQVLFEVTDHCNLNCTYCGLGELYEGFYTRNRQSINVRNAIKLVQYIFDLKHKNKKSWLSIGFYGGEPLLNIDFIKQIVEVVNQLNSNKVMNIEYSMTTNATLIPKYIDFLVANEFKLLISLDGNERNHSYRVFSKNKKNSFRKVIENTDMIQREYPEYFDKHVNFNAVLHNRNSVKDIYEFIYTRYQKVPSISQLANVDLRPEKKNIYDKMFHRKLKSEIEYQEDESNLLPVIRDKLLIYKELTNFLKYYTINFYVSKITALLHNMENKLPTSTCLPGFRKFFLTTNSQLLPCERINHKYTLGKVDENVMIDIQEIMRRYNFYYNHINLSSV